MTTSRFDWPRPNAIKATHMTVKQADDLLARIEGEIEIGQADPTPEPETDASTNAETADSTEWTTVDLGLDERESGDN